MSKSSKEAEYSFSEKEHHQECSRCKVTKRKRFLDPKTGVCIGNTCGGQVGKSTAATVAPSMVAHPDMASVFASCRQIAEKMRYGLPGNEGMGDYIKYVLTCLVRSVNGQADKPRENVYPRLGSTGMLPLDLDIIKEQNKKLDEKNQLLAKEVWAHLNTITIKESEYKNLVSQYDTIFSKIRGLEEVIADCDTKNLLPQAHMIKVISLAKQSIKSASTANSTSEHLRNEYQKLQAELADRDEQIQNLEVIEAGINKNFSELEKKIASLEDDLKFLAQCATSALTDSVLPKFSNPREYVHEVLQTLEKKVYALERDSTGESAAREVLNNLHKLARQFLDKFDFGVANDPHSPEMSACLTFARAVEALIGKAHNNDKSTVIPECDTNSRFAKIEQNIVEIQEKLVKLTAISEAQYAVPEQVIAINEAINEASIERIELSSYVKAKLANGVTFFRLPEKFNCNNPSWRLVRNELELRGWNVSRKGRMVSLNRRKRK